MLYYVSEIINGYWEQKLSLMEEQTMFTFWDEVQFLSFYFFAIAAL